MKWIKEPHDWEAIMSKPHTSLHADHRLDQLAGQFEQWRHNRSHPGERIPKALWKQAAALALVLPHTRVASHLRLSARDLKDHMAELHGTPSAPPCTPPPFVEVPPAPTLPPAALAMEIELERPDGVRLRLRCPESTSPVATLVRAFLEGAR
jgi:hypothetical protein